MSQSATARPKLLFLVTEDWYFCSDRMPFARAARDAGFAVSVAARVREHGEHIRAEGFALRPLAWRRRGDGLGAAVRAIFDIAKLYCTERPDIVHHVALKPILFGGLALRLAFPRPAGRPGRIDSIMGLGSGFSASGRVPWLRRMLLGAALRRLAGARRGLAVVQNPDDAITLAALGIPPEHIALIRGSGVNVDHFAPQPEPAAEPVRVALVARMLRDKGVLEAAAAVRRLRAQGVQIELLLAGAIDPDNPNSLRHEELAALAAEPGVEWLGRVEDVRMVWRQAAIAILPSIYGEGLPRALLEAAACARPIVTTDVPGCREAVVPGETGILVPPGDLDGLCRALATLAGDPARRRAMGAAGRAMVEREFAEHIVVDETLALYRRLLAARR